MLGPTKTNADIDHFSRAVLPADALAATLRQLGVSLDVHAFIDLVNQKTDHTLETSNEPEGRAQRRAIVGVVLDADWETPRPYSCDSLTLATSSRSTYGGCSYTREAA